MTRSTKVLASVLLVVSGCAESLPAPQAQTPRALTAYQGRATELLDDAIELGAVGMDLEPGTNKKGDAVLRARTETSDAVVRVRITTVTRKDDSTGPVWAIGF